MWPFKKKKVLDLTAKEVKVPKPSLSNGGEYKDLTSPVSSSANSESALGFLGNLANSVQPPETSTLPTDEMSLKHLKVRIEDIEYKIDSLRSRIDKILDRLDLAEKKIDRANRI